MNESQQKPLPAPYDDEIDLRELFRAVWAGKWLISSVTLLTTLIAVGVALMLPNIYRAEALLAPNDSEMPSGLSLLASQYGGLASMVGVNSLTGTSDKTTLGLEILKSRKFIGEFIVRHDILVPLMAAEGWDSASGILKIDSDDYDVASGKWIRDVSMPGKIIPSSQEAYKEFMDLLSVGRRKDSGLVTIAIEHLSPELARQWVEWLIDDLNSFVMRRDVAEATQAINYLNNQIERTSVSELRSVFFSLIEEQTKTVMLANVTDEYLLKTLDPAVSPEHKSGPPRAVIVAAGLLLGALIGTFAVILRNELAPTRK